jgi:hypothetical protein
MAKKQQKITPHAMKTKMNAPKKNTVLNVSSVFNPLRPDSRNPFNSKLWLAVPAFCAMLFLGATPARAMPQYDLSTTTVSGNPNPSTSGQTVTFTATVTRTTTIHGTGTPAGTVTFKEGTTILGTGTLSGSGLVATTTFSTSGLSAGSHTITASVPDNGSIYLYGSSGTCTQTVNSALNTTVTAINSSPRPSVTNQSVTFTATVTRSGGTATPSGNVVFRDGATALSTNALSGSGASAAAAFNTSALAYGSHTVAAEYAGDSNFSGSTNSVVQRVVGAPQVQSNGASFGVQMNQFGFNITGTSGLVIVVEACTNLANPIWFPVQTNTLPTVGSSYFSDPAWTNYPGCFYRLCSP